MLNDLDLLDLELPNTSHKHVNKPSSSLPPPLPSSSLPPPLPSSSSSSRVVVQESLNHHHDHHSSLSKSKLLSVNDVNKRSDNPVSLHGYTSMSRGSDAHIRQTTPTRSVRAPQSSSAVIPSSPVTSRMRYIPGPAGRKGGGGDSRASPPGAVQSSASTTKNVNGSLIHGGGATARVDRDFQSTPWLAMLQSLVTSKSEREMLSSPRVRWSSISSPHFRFNIQSVLLNRQMDKIQCLVVIICKLQACEDDALVTLKDPSGEMQGTIHRKVFEQYPKSISNGSVLVLRNVSVFSVSAHTGYLNITPENVVQVFPYDMRLPLAEQTNSERLSITSERRVRAKRRFTQLSVPPTDQRRLQAKKRFTPVDTNSSSVQQNSEAQTGGMLVSPGPTTTPPQPVSIKPPPPPPPVMSSSRSLVASVVRSSGDSSLIPVVSTTTAAPLQVPSVSKQPIRIREDIDALLAGVDFSQF